VELAAGGELAVEFELTPHVAGPYHGVTELYANCQGRFASIPVEFKGVATPGKED